jgi:hypothetical protein
MYAAAPVNVASTVRSMIDHAGHTNVSVLEEAGLGLDRLPALYDGRMGLDELFAIEAALGMSSGATYEVASLNVSLRLVGMGEAPNGRGDPFGASGPSCQ